MKVILYVEVHIKGFSWTTAAVDRESGIAAFGHIAEECPDLKVLWPSEKLRVNYSRLLQCVAD